MVVILYCDARELHVYVLRHHVLQGIRIASYKDQKGRDGRKKLYNANSTWMHDYPT
jgi:hypothetical protein